MVAGMRTMLYGIRWLIFILLVTAVHCHKTFFLGTMHPILKISLAKEEQ